MLSRIFDEKRWLQTENGPSAGNGIMKTGKRKENPNHFLYWDIVKIKIDHSPLVPLWNYESRKSNYEIML